jgi:hypothetical protein
MDGPAVKNHILAVIAAGMRDTGSTSQAAPASIAALGMLQTTLVASSWAMVCQPL